jgi:hypothetical protein
MSERRRGRGAARRGERGAALVIAILVLTILTVIGIALMLITSTESRIAANEWSVNRGFYSADSGVRWASAEMAGIQDFMKRPEYCPPTQTSGCPSIWTGTVLFPLPSNRHGASFFSGDTTAGGDIEVRVQAPSLVGRRFAPGYVMNFGSGQARYVYAFEVRSTGSENGVLQYSKQLVADVEVGPLADRLPF